MTDQAPLKVFECDDSDIFAARDADEAVRLWREMVGEDEELESGYPREWTDEELDKRVQAFDEDERPIEGETTSAREWLAEATEPGWLAGSNW